MIQLKKAQNKMAFAKVGLYGDAGSGKTFTAAKMAIGLHQHAKLEKPVAMFDTEPAASFIIPLFEKAGIDFLVFDESRALADLMEFMDVAERECSIVIIDSITHVWKDAQDSYIKKINDSRKKQRKSPLFRLEFHHWGPIKAEWAKFTDRYLSSKIHAIVCGRAGSIYEYQKNEETGKMELITSGTKMATEKEMGYEPSLLIEMVKHRENGRIINRALVEKDRADIYNGMEFDKPGFDTFINHFNFLNIGGKHFESMRQRDSTELFDDESEETFSGEKRKREIQSELIKDLLVEHDLDGTSQKVKKERIALLKGIFGTSSWTQISSMSSDRQKRGYDSMKAKLTEKIDGDKENPGTPPEGGKDASGDNQPAISAEPTE